MSLDLLRARVVFRDRAFPDILDLAIRFVVSHGAIYARIALVVLAPSIALTLGAAHAGGWGTGWLVAIALALAAEVPFTVLASRLVFQDEVAARDVLRDSVRDLPRMLVARLLWSILMALGGTMLLVPAAYGGASLLYLGEVILLERSTVLGAFARSHRVSSAALGDAWLGATAALLLPFFGIFGAEIGGRALLDDVLQFRAPPPFWSEGGSVLAVLGFFAIVPYTTTVRFFTYLDARTRAEGWDIQTRFASLSVQADASPEAAE